MADKFLGLFFLALVLVLVVYYKKYRTKTSVEHWKKSLNLEGHSLAFHRLYHNVDGYALSLEGRQKQDAVEYTYGEIDFLSFIALLSLVKPGPDTIFYDLGSGTGKAVLACAMAYPVRQCIGVEIIPELHQMACKQKEKLLALQGYTDQANHIQFILGNFLHQDLSEATLIFINATTFIGPIWDELCLHLDKFPSIKTVISTSKALKCRNFFMIKKTQVQMSWGVVQVYIHSHQTNFH